MDITRRFKSWEAIEEFPAGAVVFSAEEPARAVYVILEGEVDLALHGEPLGSEGPGGVIGEMALIEDSAENASATARTDVRVARLGPEDLRRMLSSDSEFALHVMQELADHLRALNAFIAERLGRAE